MVPRIHFCIFLCCHVWLVAQQVESRTERAPRAAAEVNPTPEFFLNLTTEVVEVRGNEIRKLGDSAGSILRLGDSGGAGFSIQDNGRVGINAKLQEIGEEVAGIEIRVENEATNQVFLNQFVKVKNNQEILVEVAESKNRNSRIALRLLPRIEIHPAVLVYPFIVPNFGFEKGILILNGKEVLGGPGHSGRAPNERLDRDLVQMLSFGDRRLGQFLLSYRPFPGASAAGYIEGRKLNFAWDGNVFEWYSVEKPFLPEGRWTLYVRHDSDVSDVQGDGTVGVASRRLSSWR